MGAVGFQRAELPSTDFIWFYTAQCLHNLLIEQAQKGAVLGADIRILFP